MFMDYYLILQQRPLQYLQEQFNIKYIENRRNQYELENVFGRRSEVWLGDSFAICVFIFAVK